MGDIFATPDMFYVFTATLGAERFCAFGCGIDNRFNQRVCFFIILFEHINRDAGSRTVCSRACVRCFIMLTKDNIIVLENASDIVRCSNICALT